MRHALYTDLYCLIDELATVELEIPCRITWTVTEAVPACRPMGEYIEISPAEPEGVEGVDVEVVTGKQDDGTLIWGRLPSYLHDRIVQQLEDKAEWLIEHAREEKAA